MADSPVLPGGQSERPRSAMGCLFRWLTLLVALGALVVAVLAWIDYPAPAWAKKYLNPERYLNGAGSAGDDAKRLLDGIRLKLAEASQQLAGGESGEAEEPELKDGTLKKLEEAEGLMAEWRDKAGPKIKESAGNLSRQTTEAMQAVREGSRNARQKLEELIKSFNLLEEEKESKSE